MHPYITIGDTRLSLYWMMFAVGAIGIIVLTLLRRKRYGFGIISSVLFSVLTVVLGLTGAKLLYIFENWKSTLESGITLGGVSFFGSVFLIPALMIPCGYLFKLKPKRSLDAVAPCVAVMIGFIRVGCFLNGCCGGWTTNSGFTWPTQAMESICDFMLLFFLLQLEKKQKFEGWLYPILLTSYSAYRFLIEFLRDTPRTSIGLANGHFFAIAGMIIGAIWLLILNHRKKSDIKS